jgi:hypothetical protein
MIAAVAGIVGIVLCLFVADAWSKSSGAKVAMFLAGAGICFGIAIAGASKAPPFSECDDYSRFASSC